MCQAELLNLESAFKAAYISALPCLTVGCLNRFNPVLLFSEVFGESAILPAVVLNSSLKY